MVGGDQNKHVPDLKTSSLPRNAQASNDATDWVTLIDHKEVDWSEHSKLAPEQLCFCTLSFPISGEITTAFRYFRIVMVSGLRVWG
jgi:hypothetical protein